MTDAPAQLGSAPPAAAPLVAIVGRPNVGKSSLFNALLGKRSAIVAEESGTTRDRVIAPAEFEGHRFLLADTGGLVPQPESDVEAHIAAQADAAVESADAVILVTDARSGPAYADEYVAQRLRQAGKPVAVAVNKADNPAQEILAFDAASLGLGEPTPVSALHRRGLGESARRRAPFAPVVIGVEIAQGGRQVFGAVEDGNAGVFERVQAGGRAHLRARVQEYDGLFRAVPNAYDAPRLLVGAGARQDKRADPRLRNHALHDGD